MKSKIAAILSLLACMSAQAHVHLKSANPQPDSQIMMAPKALSLTFTAPVRLVKLDLANAQGESVDLHFSPVSDAKSVIEQAIPSLKKGDYTVSWTLLGGDGHKMQDSFSFSVTMDHGDHH